MPTVVTINSTGRQTASFIRHASAIGWKVKAHVWVRASGIVYDELAGLNHVTLIRGDLADPSFVASLFGGAQLAFLNTLQWGDEVAIGKALCNAAKQAGIQHLIYSSMPDHSRFGKGWYALPQWATKWEVEEYIRTVNIPSTFVYPGIYNNNFSSLPYPLFRMKLEDDGTFSWTAPFHPDKELPWLDAEHDVGPTILQIFMNGPAAHNHERIPLAFERLTPIQVCEAFAKALQRPVRYYRGPISFETPVPKGYEVQLRMLEDTLGKEDAPYFGDDPELEDNYPQAALDLWEAPRYMEEYAREVFPVEERANGLTWMEDDDGMSSGVQTPATGLVTPSTEGYEPNFWVSC